MTTIDSDQTGHRDDSSGSGPVPTPEVRRYLEASDHASTEDVFDPVELRIQNNAVGVAVRGALEVVADVQDAAIEGIPVRHYWPAGIELPAKAVVVWVHGGGWVHGDLEVYDGLARALANSFGAEVIAVDYRLAPENPFPEGFNDVWAVVGAVSKDYETLILAGDSSGGNIAAATALRARDMEIAISAQLLMYPVLDNRETAFKKDFRSRYSPFVNQRRFGESTYERILWIWDTYVPDPILRESPYAAPLRASDFRGVAPAVIITAEHDILRGEAEEYAARLRGDDVQVSLLEFPGQIHGFLQMRGVFSEAVSALDQIASAVDSILDPGAG